MFSKPRHKPDRMRYDRIYINLARWQQIFICSRSVFISNYSSYVCIMSILLAGKLFHANEFRVISDGVWSMVQHEVTQSRVAMQTLTRTSTLLLQLVRQSLFLNMQQELSGLIQMAIHVCLSLSRLLANSSKHEGQTVLQIDMCYFTQSTDRGFLNFEIQSIAKVHIAHNSCPLQTCSRQSGSWQVLHCPLYSIPTYLSLSKPIKFAFQDEKTSTIMQYRGVHNLMLNEHNRKKSQTEECQTSNEISPLYKFVCYVQLFSFPSFHNTLSMVVEIFITSGLHKQKQGSLTNSNQHSYVATH